MTQALRDDSAERWAGPRDAEDADQPAVDETERAADLDDDDDEFDDDDDDETDEDAPDAEE